MFKQLVIFLVELKRMHSNYNHHFSCLLQLNQLSTKRDSGWMATQSQGYYPINHFPPPPIWVSEQYLLGRTWMSHCSSNTEGRSSLLATPTGGVVWPLTSMHMGTPWLQRYCIWLSILGRVCMCVCVSVKEIGRECVHCTMSQWKWFIPFGMCVI